MSGDYFSRPEMSQSKLKGFAKSPAQYKYMQDNPKKPTRDMEIGTAIHYYLLEPEEFKKRYFIEDQKVDGRTTEGKEYKALIREQELTYGKIILSKEEGDTVMGCANAALEDEDVGFLFKEGIEVEREVFFPLFGIDFKAKLDVVVPKYNVLLDVKSTALMSNDSFVKMSVSNSPMCHYDVQAYVYVEAYKYAFGCYPSTTSFIGLEKSAPYHCYIYECQPLFLDRGRYYTMKYVDMYKKCLDSGKWPKHGEGERIVRLDPPDWSMREAMEFGESFFSTMTRE